MLISVFNLLWYVILVEIYKENLPLHRYADMYLEKRGPHRPAQRASGP